MGKKKKKKSAAGRSPARDPHLASISSPFRGCTLGLFLLGSMLCAAVYAFDVLPVFTRVRLPDLSVSFTQRPPPAGREHRSEMRARMQGAACVPPFACGGSVPARRAVAS